MDRVYGWLARGLLLLLLAAPDGALALPRGGLTAFEAPALLRRLDIHLPAQPAPLEEKAAAELARVLERLTGRKPAVVAGAGLGAGPGIHLGRTRAARFQLPPEPGLDPHGYRIRSTGNTLFIRGGSPRGTLFGVYGFLQEHCGVLWLEPGPDGESLPDSPPRRLPAALDERVEPGYLSRELAGLRTRPERAWARHNRLAGRYAFNHNLFRIFDAEVARAHPQWFPLIDGRRIPAREGRAGALQPHLALPEVAAYAAEQAIAHFEADPEATSFSVAMNDNRLFDQSAETAALVEPWGYFRGLADYSPLVFTFTNRVAERVAGRFPDRKIGALAYDVTQNVPPFPVHSNVLPYLCADRANWAAPAFREQDKALIAAWAGGGPETLGLFDYLYGKGYVFPRATFEEWAAAIDYAHAHRARGYLGDTGVIWAWDAPKLWLVAQLLWDPRADPAALLERYFRRAYGEAASSMAAFFGRLDALWAERLGEPRWLKYFHDLAQFEVLPPEAAGGLEALLARAAEEVADLRQADRIARIRDRFERTAAMARFYARWKRLARLPAGAADADALAALRRERLALHAAMLEENADRWAGRVHQRLYGQMFQTSPVVRHSLAMKDATAALTGLDLPALAGVEPLDLDSGFEKKLFREPGPHAYPALRGQSRPSHWRMFATHTGELRIGQLSGAARQGGLGLRVSGAETFTLSYPARVEPGQAVLARVAVRGGVGRGARVQLMLGWRDDVGRLLDEVSVDRLPAGAYPEWMDLACAAEAPAEAASFFAVLVVQYQESGDSVDLDDFTLRVRPVDEPRARP